MDFPPKYGQDGAEAGRSNGVAKPLPALTDSPRFNPMSPLPRQMGEGGLWVTPEKPPNMSG